MAKKKKPKLPEVPVGVPTPGEQKPSPPKAEAEPKVKSGIILPAEGLNRETWLEMIRSNRPLKYGLLAMLYLVGFMFIKSQHILWGKDPFTGVGLNIFEKVLNRGQAYGVYKPVNLPTDREEYNNLTDEEKELGLLPDEAKILEEMKNEIKGRKLSREERAAPEREGPEVLKKEKAQVAPWKKTQFQVLPPSVYGKEASSSKNVSESGVTGTKP